MGVDCAVFTTSGVKSVLETILTYIFQTFRTKGCLSAHAHAYINYIIYVVSVCACLHVCACFDVLCMSPAQRP